MTQPKFLVELSVFIVSILSSCPSFNRFQCDFWLHYHMKTIFALPLCQWTFLLLSFFLATFLDISSSSNCLSSSFWCHETILVFFLSFWPFLSSLQSGHLPSTQWLFEDLMIPNWAFFFPPHSSIKSLILLMPAVYTYNLDVSFEIQAHMSDSPLDIYSWKPERHMKVTVSSSKLMIVAPNPTHFQCT